MLVVRAIISGHVCTLTSKVNNVTLDAHLVRVSVQIAYRRGTSGLLFGTFATIQLIPNDCVMTCDGLCITRPVAGGSTGVSQSGVYNIDLQLPAMMAEKDFHRVSRLFRMIPTCFPFAMNSHNISKEQWVPGQSLQLHSHVRRMSKKRKHCQEHQTSIPPLCLSTMFPMRTRQTDSALDFS